MKVLVDSYFRPPPAWLLLFNLLSKSLHFLSLISGSLIFIELIQCRVAVDSCVVYLTLYFFFLVDLIHTLQISLGPSLFLITFWELIQAWEICAPSKHHANAACHLSSPTTFAASPMATGSPPFWEDNDCSRCRYILVKCMPHTNGKRNLPLNGQLFVISVTVL